MSRAAKIYDRQAIRQEPEWLVVVTVILGVALGVFVLNRSLNATVAAPSNALRYPAGWAEATVEGSTFAVEDRTNPPFGARVSLHELPLRQVLNDTQTLEDAAAGWSITRGQGVEGYRVLGLNTATVNGRPAMQVEWAAFANPPEGQAAGALPAVLHGLDTLVTTTGDSGTGATAGGFQVLSFSSDQGGWDGTANVRQQLLRDWRVP